MNPFNQQVNPFNAHAQPTPEQAAREKVMSELRLMLDQKMLAVFNSTEGDALLEAWDDYYVRQPVVIPNSEPGTNEMREGRNAFIRNIRATVNRARGAK